MQPQHVTLGLASPRDPHMQQWIELMARHVGHKLISFSTAFFSWPRRNNIFIEDHPYVGMDFHRDLDLILLDDAQWGAIGKILTMFFIFWFFKNIFVIFYVSKT